MAISPNGTDSMDNEFCGKLSGSSDNGFADFAATLSVSDFSTLLQYRRSAGSVNRTIYATPAKQRGVCSVDNSIDSYFRNIAFQYLNHNEPPLQDMRL